MSNVARLTLTFLSSLFLLLSTVNGKTISPPSSASLIGPADTANLLFNSSIEIGISYPNDTKGEDGLINMANLTVTYPNGTTQYMLGINDIVGSYDCHTFPGDYSGIFFADQEGSYTVHYNITYGLSTDPTQANSTFCGPEPFSYQTFVLNRTFMVQAPGNGYSSGAPGPTPSTTILVSDLPSEPTGKINRGVLSSSTEGLGSRVFMLVWFLSLTLIF